MVDGTSVNLTLRDADYERLKNEPWFDAPEDVVVSGVPIEQVHQTRSLTQPSDQTRIHLQYPEVTYGELGFLYELQGRGIAYDSRWGSGDSYGPGRAYCRFTESGEIQLIEVQDGAENPPLNRLMAFVNGNNLQGLAEYLKDFRDQVTPLTWENQGRNGQRYRARQLIAPKE